MKVAEVTSIRTSAFGAFKVTRALRAAYVDMAFGVRRPNLIGWRRDSWSPDRVEHVRTPIASEIGSFEHPRFLGLELATTTRHSTHKLVSFRALLPVPLRLLEIRRSILFTLSEQGPGFTNPDSWDRQRSLDIRLNVEQSQTFAVQSDRTRLALFLV